MTYGEKLLYRLLGIRHVVVPDHDYDLKCDYFIENGYIEKI